VPPNKLSGYVSFPTAPVDSQTTVIVTLTFGGVSKNFVLTVNPVTLSSLSSYSGSVNGGQIAAVSVALSAVAEGGATLKLVSSNPAVATVPATLSVAPGKFTGAIVIQTTAVAAPTAVTVTATCGGVSKVFALTVKPAVKN
jgi:hypothetical protein